MANYDELRLALGDLLDQLELHGYFLDKITNHNFWDAYASAKEAWENSDKEQTKYLGERLKYDENL